MTIVKCPICHGTTQPAGRLSWLVALKEADPAAELHGALARFIAAGRKLPG
jgi:hypothetical protein